MILLSAFPKFCFENDVYNDEYNTIIPVGQTSLLFIFSSMLRYEWAELSLLWYMPKKKNWQKWPELIYYGTTKTRFFMARTWLWRRMWLELPRIQGKCMVNEAFNKVHSKRCLILALGNSSFKTKPWFASEFICSFVLWSINRYMYLNWHRNHLFYILYNVSTTNVEIAYNWFCFPVFFHAIAIMC